jgi:hypothetical protein
MYAFGNRADFAAWDEPFYAPYLAATGHDHPMADEIIAAHETDPQKVSARCLDSIPGEKPHFYMKHMPHHMLPTFPLDWAKQCENVHLIRHPARVIASYSVKRAQMTLDDLGFRQQFEIYDRLGGIVIDGTDIRAAPEDMLHLLCDALGLDFDPAMLHWSVGPRDYDGIWADHWYQSVHQSTGIASAEGDLPQLTGHDAELLEAALPYYEKLWRLRI